MAVQIAGNTAANIAEVETNTKAIRVTPKPIDWGSLGIYSLASPNCAAAGGAPAVMAAGLAGQSPIFSYRWGNASNLSVLKKVIISAGNTSTAFAAGVVTFRMFFARTFTASDTGGTSILPASGMNKLRTSMQSATLLTDVRISNTAALAAGTRTLDTNPMGVITSSVPATAGTPLLAPYPLFLAQSGDYPTVFAQNEGFVIDATVPITGTWSFSVQAQWEELASYVP